MSFTLQKQLKTFKHYPSLGITCPGEIETLDVTYSVLGIFHLDGKEATVKYTISLPGVDQVGDELFTFTYETLDNILDQAEANLKIYLNV